MDPAWFDHLFALLLLVLWPAYVARHGREALAELTDAADRRRLFLFNAAGQWMHVLLLGAWWAWRERPWGDLGLGLEFGWGFWISAAASAAIVAHQLRALRRVRRDARLQARVMEQVAHLLPMMPRDRRELRLFDGLSMTAGFCEEIAYRGFLLWYLGAWLSTWSAVVIAALAFGVVHLYEGPSNAARVAAAALVAAALYLLSGSLWIPMALHAVFDMLQVRQVTAALRGTEPRQ